MHDKTIGEEIFIVSQAGRREVHVPLSSVLPPSSPGPDIFHLHCSFFFFNSESLKYLIRYCTDIDQSEPVRVRVGGDGQCRVIAHLDKDSTHFSSPISKRERASNTLSCSSSKGLSWKTDRTSETTGRQRDQFPSSWVYF